PRTSKDGAHSGLTGTAGRVKDSLSRSFAACSGTLLVARVLELRGARKSKAGPRLLSLAGMASGRALLVDADDVGPHVAVVAVDHEDHRLPREQLDRDLRVEADRVV